MIKNTQSPFLKVNANINDWLATVKQRIELELNKQLELHHAVANDLQKAMHYSLLNGGKRLRAALIYSLEESFDVEPIILDHIAAAIECIHASSLIHDDLPALDDDNLRRGKPACHIAFNEAIAILAGDALLNLSHQIILTISTDKLASEKIIAIAKILGAAIGTQGMIGGQSLEFSSESNNLSQQQILELYNLKTGCLIAAGLKMVACIANRSDEDGRALEKFAYHLGLAFQIQDDILDITTSTEELGKPQNSDVDANKKTLITLMGLSEATALLQYYQSQTKAYLGKIDCELGILNNIVDYIFKRRL